MENLRAWVKDKLDGATWSSAIGGRVLPIWCGNGWTLMATHDTDSISSSSAPSSSSKFMTKLFNRNNSVVLCVACVALVALSYVAFLQPNSVIRNYLRYDYDYHLQMDDESQHAAARNILEAAADVNRTVIMTTMNAAWAGEKTMLGMFVEGLKAGVGTEALLRHVVVVCFDRVAYRHCRHVADSLSTPFHCLSLQTPGVDFSGEEIYLSHDYILMMWRRIRFLASVLEMGYNFVFTDADVLWFRNPFPMLLSDTEADFQMACDYFNGNPLDINNHPNAGFIFVKANNRTVDFYKYWYDERNRGPKMADQEVFNVIKYEAKFKKIGMKMRYLDTQFFGGFCAIQTSDMTKAITMHATCCKGLEAKLIDLRTILNDWKEWKHDNLDMASSLQNSTEASVSESKNSTQVHPSSVHDNHITKKDPKFKNPWACPRSWN